MAKNMAKQWTKSRSLICSDPATPASGDPVIAGQIPGVALTNEGAGGNEAAHTTVAEDGEFFLSVKAIDGSGNSAVNEGDILYYVTGDTPKLSKKATGVRFGYAVGADQAASATVIASGSTATIRVKVGY